MPTLDVKGLRVLITAGAAGIGRAMAESFLARGAHVHLCDVDPEALTDVRQKLASAGVTECDVSRAVEVDHLFEQALAQLDGLDVLINNAGIAGPTGPVEQLEEEEWRRTLEVNITGMFLVTRRAVPHLKAAGGGAIINLASAAGVFGFPLRTPYAASKWGVVGFTKSLAMELGPDRIRVNALCPGAVEGDRIERVIAAKAAERGITHEEMRAILVETASLKTFVTAQDIADMALYLASPSGARITGQALSIDGGIEVLR